MRTERQCRAPQWSGSGAERGGCAEDQQARESSPQRWHSCVQMVVCCQRDEREARARKNSEPIFTMARTEILESFRSPTAQSLLVPQLRGTLRMRNGNVASKEPLLCIILASIPRNCRLKWRAELLLLSAECCFGCTGESHVFHPTDRKQTFVIEQPRGCAHRRRSAESRTHKKTTFFAERD